jgi:hypothetical protein
MKSYTRDDPFREAVTSKIHRFARAYFRVEIDRLDYYDLTPTPPILRHYDRTSGQYVDLNPFGEKN